MLTNASLAAALRAAADSLEGGEAVTYTGTPVAPSLADRVADFLRNDQSGFSKRTSDAIAKALGDVSASDVQEAVRNSGDLAGSQGRMGYLIWLA